MLAEICSIRLRLSAQSSCIAWHALLGLPNDRTSQVYGQSMVSSFPDALQYSTDPRGAGLAHVVTEGRRFFMMDAKRLREVIVVALSLLLAYSAERSNPKLAFDAWTVQIPDRGPPALFRGA